MASNYNLDTVKNLNKDFIDLYLCLVNRYDKKSNVMNPLSLMNALRLLYYGTSGKTKKSLDEETNIKKMIDVAPSSMHSRTGAFLRYGYKFKDSYWAKFNENNILDYIPRNTNAMNKLNRLINKKKSSYWCEKNDPFFKSYFNDTIRLYIKDHSCFEGDWEVPFDKEFTKNESFYIGKETIQVPMMTACKKCSAFTYFDEKLDALLIELCYTNGYSMFIIMPRIPHTKEELINFMSKKLSVDDIANFNTYNKINCRYNKIKMPKFEFETEIELDSGMYFDNNLSPYMGIFFKIKDLDMRNICEEFRVGFKDLELDSITNIKNHENGTSVESITEVICFDCNNKPPPPESLVINKSFYFMIVDSTTFNIHAIGMKVD